MAKIVRHEFIGSPIIFFALCLSGIGIPLAILYLITGTVTVHRISTDEFITYRAGSGSIWPQEFKADLQAGKFGEP